MVIYIGALTQEQTDRYNELTKKGQTEQLTPEEKKELNIFQKVESGEDTDADNPGGDNNPQSFETGEIRNVPQEERAAAANSQAQENPPKQNTDQSQTRQADQSQEGR